MEYIEREALKVELQKKIELSHNARRVVIEEDFIAIIDDMPAADVVEVRHGEWVMRGGRFRCSECDGKALMQDVGGTGGFSHEFEQVKSDICPHCGAKMDGKDGE